MNDTVCFNLDDTDYEDLYAYVDATIAAERENIIIDSDDNSDFEIIEPDPVLLPTPPATPQPSFPHIIEVIVIIDDDDDFFFYMNNLFFF